MTAVLEVSSTKDFDVTGLGDAPEWGSVQWQPLKRVGVGKSEYKTRAKVLYSRKGMYFLVECEDRQLSCTLTEPFSDIYTEDVVEVFLWPDESQNLYFEYEVSPLGVELPIMVANNDGRFFGWLPWHFEGSRRTVAKTHILGGPKESMAKVDGWITEFFIPFDLLTGLANTPPSTGTCWRANIYRIDYDAAPSSQWSWCERTGGDFHDLHNFGVFVFR